MSVNIDAMHLLYDGFIPHLQELLIQYPNVQTSDFMLEILETVAIDNTDQAISVMQKCQNIGIFFSLDDFRTGYSSLAYLKRLPIRELKIDKSFVQDMLVNAENIALLDSIISLAKIFNYNVIAEGVENIEHEKFLLRLGCRLAQGYAISRPIPAKDVTQWITNYTPEPKWLNLKSIDSQNSVLIYSAIENNAILQKVLQYIDDSDLKTTPQDNTECRFGQWIYGFSKEHFEKYPNYKTLEEIHKKFHKKANEMIQKKIQTKKYHKRVSMN